MTCAGSRQFNLASIQFDCKASRMIKPVAGSEAEAGAGDRGWLSDWTGLIGLAFLTRSDLWHHRVCNSKSHLNASSISPDLWFLIKLREKRKGADEKRCGWICCTYRGLDNSSSQTPGLTLSSSSSLTYLLPSWPLHPQRTTGKTRTLNQFVFSSAPFFRARRSDWCLSAL
jgi:hypothetical protein